MRKRGKEGTCVERGVAVFIGLLMSWCLTTGGASRYGRGCLFFYIYCCVDRTCGAEVGVGIGNLALAVVLARGVWFR